MLLLSLIAFALLTTHVHTLSGQTAASFCHCDLTASFCDVDCCCDLSCVSSVTTECYNEKSNSYCPQPTFFARIGSSYLNSAGCFYYNSTNKIVEEVSLTSAQIKKLAQKPTTFTRLASTTPAVKAGYQIGDIIYLSGQSSFTFVGSNGQCITSAGSSTTFQLKFGLNMNIFCSSTNTTVVPLIFSSFSGKKLYQFSSDTNSTVNIPSFDDPKITSVTLQIVIGNYGSNNAKYIQRVVSTASSASSSQRTLNIIFVQPSQLTQTNFSPTFFPQIPSDMFYPIYLMS